MKLMFQQLLRMFSKGRNRQADSPVNSILSKNTSLISPQRSNQLARKYSGKLLIRSEINVNENEFTTLLEIAYFRSITAMNTSSFQPVCMRCHHNDPALFAKIPCARCNRTHWYCRNCINMGRIMECDVLYFWSGPSYEWPKHEHVLSWKGQRTEPQELATQKIVKTVKHGGELLVWAVTGAGKTEMLFPGIQKALQLGKRICIATPRTDVVRELLPRLQQAFQSIHIQALYSGSRDNDGTAQLILSTTHQLLRYRHAFDVLIIDEIDAFPYHQDTTLQFATNRAVKPNSAKIYLTATPREQQLRLISSRKLPHVFVPLRFHGHPLPVPSTIYCTSLKSKLSKKVIPQPFNNWLQSRDKPLRQILIFVPTIQLSKQLQSNITHICTEMHLVSKKSEVDAVNAEDKQRENKIKLFRKKQIKVLITTTILERGVTFPEIDVAVLDAGHEVFDEAALVQIAGRAGRSPIDPTGEVVYFHGGKTNAMVAAIRAIKKMNKRGEKLGETK